MSYSVSKSKGSFLILEKDTDSKIMLNVKTEKEARNICRKMNLGSGFKGWTPEFFLVSVKTVDR